MADHVVVVMDAKCTSSVVATFAIVVQRAVRARGGCVRQQRAVTLCVLIAHVHRWASVWTYQVPDGAVVPQQN